MASIGGAGTMRTFDQSASSSSAMMSGNEVIDPCPISVAADMMVMVPSGAIETHGLSALPARSVATLAARAPLPASATAKVSPAAPTMIWRRETEAFRLDNRTWFVMALDLPHGALDRAHDPLVGAAAADIRAQMLDDLIPRRIGDTVQQIGGAHDLPGLTIAALRHVLGQPRLLQPVRRVRRQAFDRRHAASGDFGHLRLAGECSLAVDMDHAGPAQPGAASELRAGELEALADHPQQRRVRRCVGGNRLPIHIELDRHSALPSAIGRMPRLKLGQPWRRTNRRIRFEKSKHRACRPSMKSTEQWRGSDRWHKRTDCRFWSRAAASAGLPRPMHWRARDLPCACWSRRPSSASSAPASSSALTSFARSSASASPRRCWRMH